jgi:glyoxylase-like metal-dependent hydrolase (beta-lactamase superfamily II)
VRRTCNARPGAGTVEIKTAMHWGRAPARLARTLLDRHYTTELPIHAWLIEHPAGPILVDAGQLASTPDLPIARFHVSREQEIDALLEAAGVRPDDLAAVVLTHLHGDHVNGVARLPGARIVVAAEALTRGGTRRMRRLKSRPEALHLDDGPFGAFARSASLAADGTIRAVPVPGHARGQIAIVVVQGDHHVMLAGDSAYTEAQLLAEAPDGVSLSARQAVSSMRAILAHARRHPTVFLPSHDPEAGARLRDRVAVPVG